MYTAGNASCLLLLFAFIALSCCEKRKSLMSSLHPADVLRSMAPGESGGQDRAEPRRRHGRRGQDARPLQKELAGALGGFSGADLDKPSARFLLDLYDKLESGLDFQHATGHVEPEPNLDRADTVRGISAQVSAGSHSEVTLNFKLPEVSPGETTELAELRIRPLGQHPEEGTSTGGRQETHRNRHSGRRGRLQRIRVSVTDSQGEQQIQRVYRVSWRRDEQDGFTILDVTRVLQDMIQSGMENFTNGSLHVSMRKPKRRGDKRGRSGRRARSVAALESDSQLVEEDAMLVLYSRRSSDLLDLFNVTAATADQTLDQTDTSKEIIDSPRSHIRNRRGAARKARKSCALKDMTVDFSTLGWSEFIVYPATFNAHVCSGKCPSPVGHEFKPTNHAILQSMMRMHDRKTPRPCCVPVELKPLMMLYKHGNDIEIREHPNMIASKCGCL